MKLLIDKKILLALLTLFWFSCNEDTEMDYGTREEFQGLTDPALQINTPVIGFQAGTENYDYAFNVINPSNELQLEEVKMYSVFTDAETGLTSEEVELASVGVEGPNRNVIAGTLDYSQLKAGVTVGGAPLPDDQLLLKVGSGWRVRFEGITSSGEAIPLAGNINVAVLSPYAGIYKYTHLEYYRINVLRNDVTDPEVGNEVFIGSVDEDTFSHNDWWGPFPWTGSKFHFSIDLTPDGEGNFPITGYEFPDGIYSGNRPLTCATEPGSMPNVNCGDSDYLDPDNDTGVHKLYMSYGYFTDGSGAREFYCELTRVVE
jgi:hypothetical protein